MSTIRVDNILKRTGTGTITLGQSGDTIALGSGASASGFGGGKVLQVVSASINTETSSSSTSYADTNLTAAITPSASSSKVLVLVNQNSIGKNSSDNAGKIQLVRGSTAINMFENDFGRNGSTALNIVGGTGYGYLDSPNTTSETTYKTQFACSVTAASKIFVQHNSTHSSMVLLEIGA